MSNDSEEIYSRIISVKSEYEHTRLTINEFRGTEYLHLRKYFMDLDGSWVPTKDGISMPLTIASSKELFLGLIEILSLAESKEIIVENFRELLEDIYP